MTALSYQATRKTFGPTVALEGLSLDLHQGELVSLLGPSGCGKTTALRIAAGFEKPDSGALVADGNDITHLPAHRRNMGMVFQSYSLFPNLTVAGNVEYGLRTRGMHKADRRRRVDEMLELVDLGALAERFAHQLSGGQQQRVALARALAIQPQVLLLDEPLSALDAKVRTNLRDQIRRIQTEVGITTLFVTHDQEEALAISDRICVMSQGRVEQVGTPTEVYRQPSTAFVARFVGTMNEFPADVLAVGEIAVFGHRLSAPTAASMAVGDEIAVLVRPEDLHLGDDGLAGSVTSVTFQGSTTLVGVRLDGLDRLVQVDVGQGAADILRPGDRVHVRIDARRAVCEAQPPTPHAHTSPPGGSADAP
jgi:putative spermidine/putrescine transport system ATP-binding protein